MTDPEAFLRAIVEYPHDLRPRLVFADWLDENVTETNGFAERAEFIRLQCEIESKPDADAEGREGVLFRANAARWWLGLPNVTVNPDRFADPNGMRTDEPSFLVRNGFVQDIRCPLAWWVGGECPCFTNEPDAGCDACHGTGRTPANGPAVVTKHPVTRAVVSDREPMSGGPGAGWLWFRDQSRFGPQPLHPESDLPPAIRDRLTTDGKSGLAIYPTREAAVEALSRVLVNWARQRAGLTPIQWEASR